MIVSLVSAATAAELEAAADGGDAACGIGPVAAEADEAADAVISAGLRAAFLLPQRSVLQQPFRCTFRQKPSRTRLHGQEAV